MPLKIFVKVFPRSKHNEVKEIAPRSFIVRVKESAQDGKANKALLRLLAKHFGVPRRLVSLKQGHTFKEKIVSIEDVE